MSLTRMSGEALYLYRLLLDPEQTSGLRRLLRLHLTSFLVIMLVTLSSRSSANAIPLLFITISSAGAFLVVIFEETQAFFV